MDLKTFAESNPLGKKATEEEKKSKTCFKKLWRPIIIFLSIMILTMTFLSYHMVLKTDKEGNKMNTGEGIKIEKVHFLSPLPK